MKYSTSLRRIALVIVAVVGRHTVLSLTGCAAAEQASENITPPTTTNTTDSGNTDSGGNGGQGGSGAAGGDAGGNAGSGGNPMPECTPGETSPCTTQGVLSSAPKGVCQYGERTCSDDGNWGDCIGEVLPSTEDCSADGLNVDEDCDGKIDEDCVCIPGSSKTCYTGPDGTLNIGKCKAGLQTCKTDGLEWGPCEGQVLPQEESCLNINQDLNCDGDVYLCCIGESKSCYTGPDGTLNIGECKAGLQTCIADGNGSTWGPCAGQVLPQAEEVCYTPSGNGKDENCNNQTNETCTSCDEQCETACHDKIVCGSDGGAIICSSKEVCPEATPLVATAKYWGVLDAQGAIAFLLRKPPLTNTANSIPLLCEQFYDQGKEKLICYPAGI